MLTVAQADAKAEAEAKAAAEAAAVLKDNSKACTMILNGVQGRHSVINGLYSPTQATGQDGRTVYLKSGESGKKALCIEHFGGQWQVKNQSDRGSGACCAYAEGDCALEDCRSREWRVHNSKNIFATQTNVKLLTEEEHKASGHSNLTHTTIAA